MLRRPGHRPPGTRPSLRAPVGAALPGSPGLNPFGADDYARGPETHGAGGVHGAAGHAPGQSVYARGAVAARTRPREKPRWFATEGARQRQRDPAPSRLAYRLNRLWLTPSLRRSLTVGLPAFLIALTLGLVVADPVRQAELRASIGALYDNVIDRPEFQIETLDLGPMSLELRAAVIARLDVTFPISSFRLDLEAMRREIEALDAVKSADLRLIPGRKLSVHIVERKPAVVWRHGGGLELLDGEGHRIARLRARGGRADLPLIAGRGAEARVPEALDILAAAAPLESRLRGLVRIGERRWDLVLDRDQRILLPESGAVRAVERVIALDHAQDLLARDLVVVDLRQPERPALRLSPGALETLHTIRHFPE